MSLTYVNPHVQFLSHVVKKHIVDEFYRLSMVVISHRLPCMVGHIRLKEKKVYNMFSNMTPKLCLINKFHNLSKPFYQ